MENTLESAVAGEQNSVREYRNLVLEGGGVLGAAYCGALNELESRGLLSKIVNYAGASVGAIVAGVLACGGRAARVEEIMRAADFRKFLDYGTIMTGAVRLLGRKGACRGEYFTRWYRSHIEALTGRGDITLGERYARYGGRLVIAVVNISKRRLEFWDHKNRPDLSLVTVVRASMSIQGLFVPVEIDGDLYVDGGTLCNYPIKAFHYDGPDGDVINPHTLGLMLLSDVEIAQKYPPIRGVIGYFLANIECLWTQPQKLYLDEQDWLRTVKIPTGNISSIDFAITPDEVEQLISAGRLAVKNYLDGVKVHVGARFHCVKSSHTATDEIPITTLITTPIVPPIVPPIAPSIAKI